MRVGVTTVIPWACIRASTKPLTERDAVQLDLIFICATKQRSERHDNVIMKLVTAPLNPQTNTDSNFDCPSTRRGIAFLGRYHF
ncbi:hypothetical protein T265_09275 [Opisthorchis viverrini]|uniref:Uncharacterized protein n=1 Tax=Opisthorchis viverrini TaxID=6198 RepID=A0A074Z6C6_OPIVI|nr:hypothetical protein T265_09275 [Opisthorchis viverrini]KER22686.1 hypothetical protein T265_09275 [Opisthorchis viverrini]